MKRVALSVVLLFSLSIGLLTAQAQPGEDEEYLAPLDEYQGRVQALMAAALSAKSAVELQALIPKAEALSDDIYAIQTPWTESGRAGRDRLTAWALSLAKWLKEPDSNLNNMMLERQADGYFEVRQNMILDDDGDGTLNVIDLCPFAQGEWEGCPDSDGDAIGDALDVCPNNAGMIEFNGCATDPLTLILNHPGDVSSAQWNKDESRILTTTQDGPVQVWDSITGKNMLFIEQESHSAAQWNPDETQIMAACSATAVCIWDATTGKELFTLDHIKDLEDAQWNADGSRILSYAFDHVARVWNATNGEELLSIPTDEEVLGVALWLDDGTRFLRSEGGLRVGFAIRIHDTESGDTLLTLRHDSGLSAIAWNNAQTRIATSSNDTTAKIWDATTGEELLVLQHAGRVYGLAWKQDGTQLITWGEADPARVWDAETGEELMALPHDKGARGARWSNDNSRIFSWSYDNTIKVWDANTGEQLLAFDHYDGLGDAIWNADESLLLSLPSLSSYMPVIRVWDATTGDALFNLPHGDRPRSASWSADGSRILSWGDDDITRVWTIVNVPR